MTIVKQINVYSFISLFITFLIFYSARAVISFLLDMNVIWPESTPRPLVTLSKIYSNLWLSKRIIMRTRSYL